MKRIFALIVCIILCLTLSVSVYADMGPKASVRITFTGASGETYYGTLLSKHDSTGPASAWDGGVIRESATHGEEGYPVWQKFVDYEDIDGFYFLQEWWDCTDSDQLNWTYYPPSPFKILLYFPESDTFLVSPIYERYAFDSYFTVDLSDGTVLTAVRNYDCTWELLSLAARIVLTLLIEFAVALLFGYRQKKLLSALMIVNIVTQIALNVSLNVINYQSGSLAFTFYYILLEIAVFVVEAFLYCALLRRYGETGESGGKVVGYAFCANLLSFLSGLILAHVIPGIF